MQTYGHLRDKHSSDMAQKVVFGEQQPTPNVTLAPNASSNGHIAASINGGNSNGTVAKAKAKYKYPWWASDDPTEVFWGQANEKIQIVPLDHYHARAQEAMGRVVFKGELNEPQALIEEFTARVPAETLEALLAKIPCCRQEHLNAS